MIDTSSNVKPRVVIFHMTLTIHSKGRISSKGKTRANVAAHANVGKSRDDLKFAWAGNVEKVEIVDFDWKAG